MAKTGDILLGSDFDLLIRNGDFVLGDATEQNKAALLLANTGHYRQNPVVGVGLIQYLNDDGEEPLGAIQLQFELDGMVVEELSLINGVLNQSAYYSEVDLIGPAVKTKLVKSVLDSTYKVAVNQSMMDVAIELCGSMDGLMEVLMANGWDMSTVVQAGQVVIDAGMVYDQNMLDYLSSNEISIASGVVSSGLGEFSLAFTSDFD